MRAPGPNGVILPSEADSGSGTEGGSAPELLLSVRELTHRFAPARGLGRGRALPVQALRGVSLDLWKGECLAVVGESGSGKTTLARAILSLIRPTGGKVLFRGRDVLKMRAGELMEFRRRAQIVFQDPFGSLNPRLRAGAMLEEVLKVHGNLPGPGSRRDRVAELLRLVGLNERHAGRFPHEFSGGQRQRLGIARALSVDPELLVLDEPVSALDLSVRAQVLNLLKDLQQRLSLTMLLVAHDLSVVRQVADRVVLLYAGTVVESAPVEALFADPVHPYTRGLMAAADPLGGTVLLGPAGGDETMGGAGSQASPATDPLGITAESSGRWASIPGESPSPTRPPEGCAFHPRCPHALKDEECVLASPGLTDLGASRTVACWKEGRGGGGA
jgi:oligopeptide transport system ATP-binding protein